jgi:adenylyltransferase/sulfurtransferase
MSLGISIQAAKVLLDSRIPLRLVDVREVDEFAICRIPAAELIPLSGFAEQYPDRLPNREERILFYCHHGMRSMRAAEYLAQRGYTNVSSLNGGIDAWAQEVDPSIARY